MRRTALERSVAIPLRGEAGETGGALEGVFVPGRPGASDGAVIAPPHPLYGGSLESPVVSELAWACEKAGIASLRFNWRGVGASTGEASGSLIAAEEDYLSALEHLARSVEGPLVAAGYSFGAAVAARIASTQERVDRCVLVAPPPALCELSELAGRARVLVLVGEFDEIASPAILEAQAAALPAARFVPVEEADHFFARGGLAELGEEVARWLAGPS